MNINRVVGRMLTLKHFLNRPTWAAAAGYDFNYLDCMAFTADKYDAVFSALADVCYELPSTEVRDLPLMLVVLIAALAGIVVWPLIFWIATQVGVTRRASRSYRTAESFGLVKQTNAPVVFWFERYQEGANL